MPTLHIIGNGFDLAHGIESKYTDLRKYAISHGYSSIITELENTYPKRGGKRDEFLLWCDLEEALGNPDFDAVFKEATYDFKNGFDKYSHYVYAMEEAPGMEVDVMFNKFRTVFKNWVNDIIIYDGGIDGIPYFDSRGRFLSFNYTETLERLYLIPRQKICYIHGRRKTKDTLQFGHGRFIDAMKHMPKEREIYHEEAYRGMGKVFNEQRKDVDEIIASNSHFFDSLTGINVIVVYGHSLSKIDEPYFYEILHIISNEAKWHFSLYYNDDAGKKREEKRVKSFCDTMHISNFSTFRMPQYYDENQI